MTARFWNRIANYYSRRPVADEASYQRKLEVTREYFRPDTEVLELGCGTGSTAIAHAPYVKHIQAVDFSRRMIDIARAKAEAGKVGNVTFQCAAIDELQVSDQRYDAVLALSILHLVESRDETLSKIHRILRPGGILVTSTVCIGETLRSFKVIAPIGHFLGLMPLIRVFTIRELAESISRAGFTIEHQWHPGKNKAVFIVARKVAPDRRTD